MYPFLVLFMLVVISSVCKGLHENTCDVVPKDPYIEVGSDITIVCQTSCVHGKIFWTLDKRSIDESLSNTVNSSHAVLSLRNFTHRNATLECHHAATRQVLGGTFIRTYSKPSNISCMLHYGDQTAVGMPELFTCSWKHQVDSSLKVNYTVLHHSSSNASKTEICNSRKTTCTSNYVDIGSEIHIFGLSTVTVRAKSGVWEVYSDPYEFDPFDILKIVRPKLKVTAISDRLLVEWSIKSRLPEKYRCHVKYSEAGSQGTPELLNKTLENREEEGKVTTGEVKSCTNYTVAVRCALGNAPWSDWSEDKTVLTKLNKSDVKLRLWRKVAEAGQNGVRKVHAMWAEIPSTCQGTFTYTINQMPYGEQMTGRNYMDTSCGSSTCDVDVNQHAHRINLRVFHNESLFVEDSVYVPAIGESLPQVADIQTATLKGVILVSWKAPVQQVSGYMIDYTHDGNQYYWKETKHTNTTLLGLLDKKPYDITVTPLFDDKTGRGTQALQICSRVGDPGKVTNLTVQANDKSALVSWTVESREACSGVVANYTVFYNAEKGPQLNVTVDNTMQDIFLKDLKPETQYSVYVKATAFNGASTRGETHFKTKRFDPRLITALSVCGSILIVFVFSLGLCCAVQWRKFKERPVPNPGLSSLALWPSASDEKRICPFQPFSNPSESPCERVYPAEAQRTSPSPLTTGSGDSQGSDQAEEYVDPATVPAPVEQNEAPVQPVETRHPSFPEESTELLSSENSPSSPYRSQSSVEAPTRRTSKQCKHVTAKQQEKTPPLTVYVTLDIFEQGQGR